MNKPEPLSKTEPFCPHQLRADVMHYAAMGDHRTGSDVDNATAQWIRDRLEQAGFHARLDPWPLRLFHLHEAWIEVCGRRLDAFPLWHPKPIGPEPFSAPLSLIAKPGHMTLMQFDDVMVTPKSDHAAKIEAAAKAGATAIIACTPHSSGEVYGQNVIPPFNQTPWPIPVLMTAPRDWHVLADAATHSDIVTACLAGEVVEDAEAQNVVATVERGPRWIVISTPQSGWFRCAGERGAGVALLMALAEWAAGADLPYSFLFLSNSGHEIGHMGIHHLMEQDTLPDPEHTACWLHLGASIGTRAFVPDQDALLRPNGPNGDGWLFSSADLTETLCQSFADVKFLQPQVYNRKNGEIRWILEKGYPAFSLMGPQKFFHLVSDGPENVDEALLVEIAGAVVRVLNAV